MLVRDFMTTTVFTIRVDKKIFVAKEIMSWAHIRHVPVVDRDGRVVGMISNRDLLRASIASISTRIARMERDQHLWSVPVREVMRTEVETIRPDAPVQEAARKMMEGKVGCLPVVDEGQLLGVISEFDLLGMIAQLPR